MSLSTDLKLYLATSPAVDGLTFTIDAEDTTIDGLPVRVLRWSATATQAVTTTLRLRLPLAGESVPWFMIPGLMYGENRPSTETRPYPRFDPAVIEPKGFVASHWAFTADRGALPGVFAWADGRWTILASEPHFTTSGTVTLAEYEPQVGIGYRWDAQEKYLQVSVPATDEPYALSGSAWVQPYAPTLTMAAGASVSGTVYLFSFEADRHGYAQVIERIGKAWGAAHPYADVAPREEIIAAAIEGIRWHYVENEAAFLYSLPFDLLTEQIANAKGVSMNSEQMAVGWTSGFPVCFGLSWASRQCGNADGIRMAHQVADKFSSEGISPSGFFWGRYATPHPEAKGSYFQGGKYNGWDGGWNPSPDTLHTRTLGEGNNFLARFIAQERAAGVDTARWTTALASNVANILAVQRQGGSGTFGTYYNAFSGEVEGWDGCGGLMWIPALLAAGPVLGTSFLEQAARAGDFYEKAVREEYIYGAPEDVGMTPTSEDGYNAIMAYTALYDATGDARYLELCRIAADWTMTYRKAYNVRLHPKTLLGAYDYRSRGGDFASVRNNHLHVYGLICTGDLLKLAQWTGNPYYRDMALAHWAYSAQLIALVDGQYNGYRGFMAEQVYQCNYTCLGNSLYLYEGTGDKPDWIPPKGFHNKGNFAQFTNIWCINHLLLAAEGMARAGE